jgi:hypothetical protein
MVRRIPTPWGDFKTIDSHPTFSAMSRLRDIRFRFMELLGINDVGLFEGLITVNL